MSLFNFHTHTNYCDGTNEAEEMILFAIANNFSQLGISTHAPVPFESDWNMNANHVAKYIKEISELKLKYADKIAVYLGFEADYVSGIQSILQFRLPEVEFLAGGTHFLGFLPDGTPWDCDRSSDFFDRGLREIFGNDINSLITAYFNSENELIGEKPDILTHVDLIKKFNSGNRFFDENDRFYRNSLNETIALAAENNVIVEINTRGWYKGNNPKFYPDMETVKFGKEKNALFTISSDAHQPDELTKGIRNAGEMLEQCGVRHIYYRVNDELHEVSIKEYLDAIPVVQS